MWMRAESAPCDGYGCHKGNTLLLPGLGEGGAALGGVHDGRLQRLVLVDARGLRLLGQSRLLGGRRGVAGARVRGVVRGEVELGRHGDAHRRVVRQAPLADGLVHGLGRGHHWPAVHGHGEQVAWLLGARGQVAHELHSGGVKGVRGPGAVSLGPVAAARGRDPHEHAALVQRALHGHQRLAVRLHLGRLELGHVVQVLLGVHAEQVAAHGEGLAQRVGHHAVARDVDDVGGQLGVAGHEHVRKHARVRLRLVVGQQHHVVPRVDVRLDLVPAVLVAQHRVVEVGEGAHVALAECKVVIVGAGDALVEGGEGVRLDELVGHCVCNHGLNLGSKVLAGTLLVAGGDGLVVVLEEVDPQRHELVAVWHFSHRTLHHSSELLLVLHL
mmetsp:Transcript_7822/g.19467  ORF Transcript_7822/g.19467 Transcript_7822/m.19467 type:complete len:384 (-) Transcript_7822:222-1373(-)